MCTGPGPRKFGAWWNKGAFVEGNFCHIEQAVCEEFWARASVYYGTHVTRGLLCDLSVVLGFMGYGMMTHRQCWHGFSVFLDALC